MTATNQSRCHQTHEIKYIDTSLQLIYWQRCTTEHSPIGIETFFLQFTLSPSPDLSSLTTHERSTGPMRFARSRFAP
jgi:hypothetical protein